MRIHFIIIALLFAAGLVTPRWDTLSGSLDPFVCALIVSPSPDLLLAHWNIVLGKIDSTSFETRALARDLILKHEPVIGKTKSEIIKVWGEPESKLTSENDDFGRYMCRAEGIEYHRDPNLEEWSYDTHGFDLINGRCVRSYKWVVF